MANMRMNSLIERVALVADFAKDAGVVSAAQLSVFIRCAKNEGSGLYDLFGLESDSLEYKRTYCTVRKLMQGSPTRKDGLYLLCWGNNINNSALEREVLLTPSGRKLFERMEALLEPPR